MILPRRPIRPHEVVDHYDDLDDFYREIWGEHVHHGLWRAGTESAGEAVRLLVGHLAARLEIAEGTRVVDVGSGYGATARQLAEVCGARVTAVTVSPAQHSFATRSSPGTPNPRYLLQDWLRNDLPDASFERAIAIESTEHMEDKSVAFGEMRRVLVEGGKVGIYAWIAADAPTAWQIRHLLEPICREGRLPGMGTEADYRALLAASGLELESVEDLTREAAPTWRHSVRRLGGRLVRDGRYRRYLRSRSSRNREFALTLLRILLAYRLGAMRYLLFVARRPGGDGGPEGRPA
jgi:tocopherol O-methyltransferase